MSNTAILLHAKTSRRPSLSIAMSPGKKKIMTDLKPKVNFVEDKLYSEFTIK